MKGEGRATVKKQHAPLTVPLPHAGAGAGARMGGILGFDPFPPGSRRASGSACLPPVCFFLQGHPCPPACPSGPRTGAQLPAGRPPGPWLSGCQFLDGSVVVLRDGGRQGVPAVGVELDDLQEQRPGQHRLRGAQHLVSGTGQELGHHLGQLLLQQPARALQLWAEKGVRLGQDVGPAAVPTHLGWVSWGRDKNQLDHLRKVQAQASGTQGARSAATANCESPHLATNLLADGRGIGIFSAAQEHNTSPCHPRAFLLQEACPDCRPRPHWLCDLLPSQAIRLHRVNCHLLGCVSGNELSHCYLCVSMWNRRAESGVSPISLLPPRCPRPASPPAALTSAHTSDTREEKHEPGRRPARGLPPQRGPQSPRKAPVGKEPQPSELCTPGQQPLPFSPYNLTPSLIPPPGSSHPGCRPLPSSQKLSSPRGPTLTSLPGLFQEACSVPPLFPHCPCSGVCARACACVCM